MNFRKRHGNKHRSNPSGEHPSGDLGQVLLACLFDAIWILDTFFVKHTTFLNDFVPLGFRIPLGAAFLIISDYLARTDLSIVFGDKIEKPHVIRKSVFSIVRHPIYLSEILFYLGLLMLSISLAAALVWAVAIFFYITSRVTKNGYSLLVSGRNMEII